MIPRNESRLLKILSSCENIRMQAVHYICDNLTEEQKAKTAKLLKQTLEKNGKLTEADALDAMNMVQNNRI